MSRVIALKKYTLSFGNDFTFLSIYQRIALLDERRKINYLTVL